MLRRFLAGLVLAFTLLSGAPGNAAPLAVLPDLAAALANLPHPGPSRAGLSWDDHPAIRPETLAYYRIARW